MGEEPKDQGLQNDGASLEPSQNTEGNLNPDPSQDNTDQAIADQLQQLPDQDDRGVPQQNVLSEVLRKMNQMSEELKSLKTAQYQQPKQFQEYHEPNLQRQQQQQTYQIMPRTPEEAAKMIENEIREKFGAKMGEPGFDPLEMLRYQNQRMMEINNSMTSHLSHVENERASSETRARNVYADLGDLQSPLSRGVINEINRRASMLGMTFQDYYKQNPYAVESVAPLVASGLGILPKTNGKLKIQPSQNINLPPSSFEGKRTVPKEQVKPTQEDIAFGNRFGVKPDTLAKTRQSGDPTEFVDESNILLS